MAKIDIGKGMPAILAGSNWLIQVQLLGELIRQLFINGQHQDLLRAFQTGTIPLHQWFLAEYMELCLDGPLHQFGTPRIADAERIVPLIVDPSERALLAGRLARATGAGVHVSAFIAAEGQIALNATMFIAWLRTEFYGVDPRITLDGGRIHVSTGYAPTPLLLLYNLCIAERRSDVADFIEVASAAHLCRNDFMELHCLGRIMDLLTTLGNRSTIDVVLPHVNSPLGRMLALWKTYSQRKP